MDAGMVSWCIRSVQTVTDSLPRYGVIKGIGKVRILSYEGNGYFTVLDCRDVRRFVPRERITFTKR